jgi:hypothetical protein
MRFRIGVHVGDIIIEGEDILGDGVNIAARIEGVEEPGGIAISEDAWRQVQGKVTVDFVDAGERDLKNIPRPVRVYRVQVTEERAGEPAASALQSPETPSIAVLPFQNMSADGAGAFLRRPGRRHHHDFVEAGGIARDRRNSSFVYKGRSVDVREAAKQLGVRYILEGAVRKAIASESRRS